MSAIDQINANGQDYDIMSPEVVSDYVEKLGTICKNPNGYTKGSLFLARDAQGVERMYKATANITSNQTITVGTNCTHKKLGDLFNEVDSEVGNVKQALSDEVVTRATLGAHNLGRNFKGTEEINNVTFTRNVDDSITATCSGSYSAEYVMASRGDKKLFLPNGIYVLSGGVNATNYVGVGCTKNGGWNLLAQTTSNDGVAFTVNGDDFSNDGAYISLYIDANGTNLNETFYPMIRLATDTDPTYQPYAMTNKELTEAIGQFKLLRIEGDAPSSTSSYEAKYISDYISAPAWFIILAAEKHNSVNNTWYEIATDPSGADYVMKSDLDGATQFRVKFSDITNYDKFRALVAYIPK